MKILFFLLIPFILFAQEIQVDFEEGGSWNYSLYFDDASTFSDEWTITSTSPHGGTYCAASEDPGAGGIINSSLFMVLTSSSWGDSIFVRYWAKYPTNYYNEATDANGGCNNVRWRKTDGAWNLEWVFREEPSGGTFIHFYDALPVRYPSTIIIRDNVWHEYAFLLVNPSASGVSDGIARLWIDGTVYTAATVFGGFNYTWTVLGNPINDFIFGTYYKGVCSQNWQFYMDDIEVWLGMAAAGGNDVTNPTATVTLTKVSNTSITYGVSNISTDIDTLKVTKVATTLRNKKNVATDWDTTLTGLSSGWHKFTTRMVDDSSNVTVRNDSLKLGVAKVATMISIIKKVP